MKELRAGNAEEDGFRGVVNESPYVNYSDVTSMFTVAFKTLQGFQPANSTSLQVVIDILANADQTHFWCARGAC